VEQRLAEIWAELLHMDRIGRFDHFFELGGHSLLAVTLISRMQGMGLHTDVRTIFANPILSCIAAVVRSKIVNVAEIQVPDNPLLKPSECHESEAQYVI
jgi:arthrofactin-type cyclic lipopeptide synthetase C